MATKALKHERRGSMGAAGVRQRSTAARRPRVSAWAEAREAYDRITREVAAEYRVRAERGAR